MKTPLNLRQIPQPSSDEILKIYKRLKEIGIKSAVLSVVPGFAAHDFIPKNMSLNLPDSLKKLYKEDLLNLDSQELTTNRRGDVFDTRTGTL